MSHWDLLSSLVMRLVSWSWRNGGSDEDLQLSYLPPWPEGPVGSQGVGAGVKQWLGGRKFGGIDLCEPLQIRVERKGRPQEVAARELGMRQGDWFWRS